VFEVWDGVVWVAEVEVEADSGWYRYAVEAGGFSCGRAVWGVFEGDAVFGGRDAVRTSASRPRTAASPCRESAHRS